MRNERVKSSATPFAGYRFQALFGVKLLVDWLDAPATLTRVRFECDDKSIGPQGLDDIVSERADGRFDYLQVKYTPPEAANGCLLTWDWLLSSDQETKNPKSFLQRWAKALSTIPPGRLGSANLVTNRTPDREIESSLNGGHLDFDLAPKAIQAELEQQFGSAAAARTFLGTLGVQHSEHGFLRLEAAIKARLEAMGYKPVGIARLLSRAADWGNFKEDPAPDGWITLESVRDELSLAQPSPIPQDFIIPQGYEPPNQAFHEGLLKEISVSTGGLVTLIGPPGRGKSTYISFLCEQLIALKVPVIRHHYFLSLGDRSGDRLSPARVARSLLSQISLVAAGTVQGAIDTDRSEGLANALERCGQAWVSKGTPFVVVIDGLDHVWRDNGGDVRPLDELFRQLLPLPKNVLLLVGTQPVADERLPLPLLSRAPRNSWRELPPMSGDAVHGYVMNQVRGGRWKPRWKPVKPELAKCAAALHDRTHGHPLHVIYSLEELLGRTAHPSEHDIRALPDCPGDDIRAYYRALWHRLTYAQRDVLHLMSALRFRWPARAFEEMSLGKDPGLLTIEGVRHLLFETGLGLQPFHESLVVFIKEVDEHAERVAVLLPRAEGWLREGAPARLRNTWHWLVLAKLADTRPLRQGLTRDWVLERLVEGYPVESLARMLTVAEEAAFGERAYGEAYRHRWLKTRLLNGPSYQVEYPSRLLRAAWAVSTDSTLSQDAFVARHQFGASVLPWLALALKERGDDARARDVARYAIDRWNSELRLSPRRASKEALLARLNLQHAGINCGALANPEKLARFAERTPEWTRARVQGAYREGESIQLIVETWHESAEPAAQCMLEDTACEMALFVGADITGWAEFAEFRLSTLAAVVGILKGKPFANLPCSPFQTEIDRSTDVEVRRRMLHALVRDWFLRSLLTSLYAGEADFCWLEAPRFADHGNLPEYLDVLENFAEEVAGAFQSGAPLPFEAVFQYFGELPEPRDLDYQQRDTLAEFRRGLLDVAVTVHLLSTVLGGPRRVPAMSWEAAEASTWLLVWGFPEFALLYGLRVFSDELVRSVIDKRSLLVATELQETSSMVQDVLDLCELAILYGEAERAQRLCRQAWDLTIGYGHRKDPALDEVVTALEYLASPDPETTRKLLYSVAPQIANITRFTDGSGTKHIPSSASALLAKLDRAGLAKQYDELVKKGEWYEAEASMQHLLQSAPNATAQVVTLAGTGLSEKELPVPLGPITQHELVARIAKQQQGATAPAGTKNSGASSDKSSTETVDFAAYPPSAFAKLLADVSEKPGTYSDALCDWFQHWKEKGKASVLVKHVRPKVLAEGRRQLLLHRLLDDLLQTCIELEGASEGTFEVAIKAQMDNGGWFRFFERSEKTEARLAKVAMLFPRRADEFISRSAKNWLTTEGSPSERVIPGEKLVYFLIILGRVTEAVSLAQNMADSVIADTSGLSLARPAWA